MNTRIILILVISFFVVETTAQSRIETAVNTLLQKPEYKNASVGINVVDLESGNALFSLNPNRVLIPASTMKLITSATALEILGEEYRFKTQIAYRGRINDKGVLKGDLVLIGGADPSLGSEYFQEHYFDFMKKWAQAIKAAGINKVDGDIILDATVYDSERIPDTWIWGDMANYYGAGANAFTVYDNLFRITFKSPKKTGRPTEVIAISPQIKGMNITNEVLSANNNRDNAYVFGGAFDKARIIRGTIPRNRSAFTIKAAIHQPEEIVGQEFQNILANNGIFVSGNVKFETVNQEEIEIVFIQESPTLAQIAKVLNHESVNLFAEHFLKQIAVETNGVGNRNNAIDLVHEYWQNKGLSTEYLFMKDGSGLSHFNALSPTFFTNFLRIMEHNSAFVNSLPSAGEGTLTRFHTSLLPDRTLQVKSGSMTRVRCYAGYLKTDSGKTLAISFMFNHFSGSHSALIKEIEHLFVLLKSEY